MKASKARPVNTSRTVLVVGGGIVIASLATFGVLYAVGMLAVGSRQAIVRDRGAQVMPFDLDQTTHIFTPTGTGGVEKVIVKDSNDAEQIRMIQDHLEHEAAQFSNGDFADPAAIHGERMPGLA